MALEGLAGHTARHVALLDDLRACADLPVVKLKHEMTEGRWQRSEVRGQKSDSRGQMFPIANFGFWISDWETNRRMEGGRRKEV
jgi:hypothetical protein